MPATMTTYPAGTPVLVGYDGGATELSDEAYRIMRTVLRVVQGVGDGAEETDPYVSTGQAAEILGVSARTVARYLDAGTIPCMRRGTGHRKARLSAVLAYKETRTVRARELAHMREKAADGGLYDLDLSDQMFSHFEGKRQ
ncbi:MAG: helix-turn-helix domain-containing protein [Coriobacteriales bacterium]|nr:helix-turn-helix domain-containing protein [Coriobacteriales bacterium]